MDDLDDSTRKGRLKGSRSGYCIYLVLLPFNTNETPIFSYLTHSNGSVRSTPAANRKVCA